MFKNVTCFLAFINVMQELVIEFIYYKPKDNELQGTQSLIWKRNKSHK